MTRPSRLLTAAVVLALVGAPGLAGAQGASIYTCIDAKGRRLTSDRPITDCIDREQRELNPSGTVRRLVPPSLTAPERAALEERERKAAEERQREQEERRVARVLVARYPNQAAHDAERARALQSQQEVIAAGKRRIGELAEQRRDLDREAEFYKSPAEWPPRLKRLIEENWQQVAAQQRFIAAQEEEKRRIDARFQEELGRLRILWAQRGMDAAASGAAAAAAAK